MKKGYGIMKRKFTQRERETIKNYYLQRKLGFTEETKTLCLDKITQVVLESRKLCGFLACAGTFWFTWKDKIITQHSEADWWRMRIFRRKAINR